MILKIRQQNNALQLLNRKLIDRIERADRLHLIEIENDTIRIVVSKRKHIDYASTNGKLSRLDHEIDMFEVVFQQGVGHKIHIHLLAHCKL